MEHVETVFPSHLYRLAVTLTVRIEVGQQHVGVHLAVVDARYWQHACSFVAVAMHEHSGASLGTRRTHVEGVGALAGLRHHDERVAQGAGGLQTVEPRLHLGEALLYLRHIRVAVALNTHKGVVDEVERGCRDYGKEERKDGAKGDE